MGNASNFAKQFLEAVHIPNYIKVTDVIEILIIAFLVYQILVWIKNTRAWALLKGVLVIGVFVLIAAIFNMTTILWIVQNVIGIAVIAFVIVMQPELRKALEQLGSKNFLSSLFPFETTKKENGLYSDKTLSEISRACFEMGKVRTGALIVLEQNDSLADYERTGIEVDGVVTSQLLINIFEKNTPLHDGAVIVRGDRVTSATCYLPISQNMTLSKELGTRHRAAAGVSEETDSLTVIVSEETGAVSVAYMGRLYLNLTQEGLKEQFSIFRKEEETAEKEKKHLVWKGRRGQ